MIKAARIESKTAAFWLRREYKVLPNDPRLLGLTDDQIALETYALLLDKGFELCECGNLTKGRFCEKCGRETGKTLYRCDNTLRGCKAIIHPDWDYCPECGHETSRRAENKAKDDEWFRLAQKDPDAAYRELVRIAAALGIIKEGSEITDRDSDGDKTVNENELREETGIIPGLSDDDGFALLDKDEIERLTAEYGK